MAELYLISFIFFLIAGVLSHDRSVVNPPSDKVYNVTYFDTTGTEG